MTTTLVIGANRGIGLELTKQLTARGDAVIATCRTSNAELEATKAKVIDGIDITKRASIDKLAKSLDPKSVDIVFVVAGALKRSSLGELDAEVLTELFDINAVGPLMVTEALVDRIKEGGKVGLLTSRMGSVADNDSGGAYAYRMSKAALNAGGKSLSVDLAPKKIAVTLLHPGWVKTDMTGGTGHLTPQESAQGLIARIDELTMATTGRFVHQSGEALPW